jgi:periplasmic protein TonB
MDLSNRGDRQSTSIRCDKSSHATGWHGGLAIIDLPMGLLFPELSSAHGHTHSLGPSPVSLTVVVAAHVAIIALLATFVPTERIAEMTRPFTARLIELAPKVPEASPPPPVVEPPKSKPQPKAAPVQPRILAVATPAPAAAVEFVVPVQPPPPVAVLPAPTISAPPAPPVPIVPVRFDAAYLNNPKPVYPTLSRQLGEEGKVVLRVHVDADGRVMEVAIKASSGLPRLDSAAHAAVAQWRFVPARRGDTAIDAWVLVPIVFKLED